MGHNKKINLRTVTNRNNSGVSVTYQLSKNATLVLYPSPTHEGYWAWQLTVKGKQKAAGTSGSQAGAQGSGVAEWQHEGSP